MIKKYYNNWKDLVWYGKILSTPGILIALVLMILLSPVMLVFAIIAFTLEVFDCFDSDGPY